ncbi:ROK family transcriptional regulator [Salinibacterium sp. TMP30]|uniref:ROK family transcriptional regulator n=1 Tax=Salinibacterium sp. TMP30 TaxID=3138237 RepID=UPI003139157C
MTIEDQSWTRDGGASLSVALQVLINGPISRSDIARRLDMSPGSLTRLSTPLIDGGLLVEVGERADGRAGRPSTLLDVVARSRNFIGMKITSTEVLAVVTDLRASVLHQRSAKLTSRDPSAVIAVIADLVQTLAARVPSVTAIGIGLGGLVGADGIVESAPFLEWTDVSIRALVEDATGFPTVIDNDLVAFTEYERWFGAGKGLQNFAVLTLGAGIGYGVVIHNEIVTSVDSGIGLVGHWPLDPFGPVCPAGHRGCAKSVLEQGAIVRNVSAVIGREVTYDQALDLAEAGEPAARRIIDEAGAGLGTLLAAIANLTMPQRIILGGEGVRLVDVASAAIQEGINGHRDARASAIDLVATSGDNTEWCRGAAVLAIQKYVLDK